MRLRCVLILLVVTGVAVVAQFCDLKTHYEKDGNCCKMCEPGKKMQPTISCEYPMCVECDEGEYQVVYTTETRCQLQPSCDPNLNLQTPVLSKTERIKCVCKPDHHCASESCDSCFANTVCRAGTKVSKAATQTSDTVCEPCPPGTFSTNESATTCIPWTPCPFGEDIPGSSTLNRLCKEKNHNPVTILLAVLGVVVVVVLVILVVGLIIWYRKGSLLFFKKEYKLYDDNKTPQPQPEHIVHIETEQPERQHNQPQENTDEDLLKNDEPLLPGISENGQPVIQDNSKSLLLSEAETEPESFQDRL